MSQPLTVDCPTCGAPVEWKATNLNRPFCSDRCKLIDLGAWAADAVGIATLASGMLVFFATHGRHPAWCALLVIATLVWWR